MLKCGLARGAIEQKMRADGADPTLLCGLNDGAASAAAPAPAAAAPPPGLFSSRARWHVHLRCEPRTSCCPTGLDKIFLAAVTLDGSVQNAQEG